MPKRSDRSFLIAWTRQLRGALDEGLQEAYEAAECIADALDLVDGPDGDAGPGAAGAEMELADDSGGDAPEEHSSGDAPGDVESDIARVRRLERELDALRQLRDRDHDPSRLLGGAGRSAILTDRKSFGRPRRDT